MDLQSPQDVLSILKTLGQEKIRIVVDNFHYLSEEVQREMAFDLRVWADLGVYFVIIGIWRQDNFLQAYNTELSDRVVEIPVEPWTSDHFTAVAQKGCEVLRIETPKNAVATFAAEAGGSIGVFQELMRLYLEENGVVEAKEAAAPAPLNETMAPKAILEKKAKDYETGYRNHLYLLARDHKAGQQNPLYLKYYLVRFIIETDPHRLRDGVPKPVLAHYIKDNLHREVEQNVLTSQLGGQLARIDRAQTQLGLPPLCQYVGKLFRLTDPIAVFWLRHADKKELIDDLVFPGDLEEQG